MTVSVFERPARWSAFFIDADPEALGLPSMPGVRWGVLPDGQPGSPEIPPVHALAVALAADLERDLLDRARTGWVLQSTGVPPAVIQMESPRRARPAPGGHDQT